MTKGGATAKGACADDRNAAVWTVAEPRIQKLRSMLMPVKAKTETAVNEVLYGVTSRVMCQGDWGTDSLRLVFVNEDREEDAVH